MARAGLFRDRATFQRMAATTDDYGNVAAKSWSNLFTRSVELIERTGAIDDTFGALQDVSVARLKLRSDSEVKTITTDDRVVVRGTNWAIRSIAQATAKGDVLEIRVEKGVAT